MTSNQIEITPSVTVHVLLKAYPELEDVLISMAPLFKKLKNPLLRKSAARVATLEHIAAMGNIPLIEMLNTLRDLVGQSAVSTPVVEQVADQTSPPDWFSADKTVLSVDFDQLEDNNAMPIAVLLEKARGVNKGEIIELTTTFLPTPGIELMQSKGYSVWVQEAEDGLVRSYFLKNTD
jgi:hypothetical protein